MKAHLRAYAEAYFTGFLFVLLQVTLAFLAQAKLLTPEIRAHMGRFDWLVFWNLVAAASIPTVLAHLNGAVGRGRSAAAAAEEWRIKEIMADSVILDGKNTPLSQLKRSPGLDTKTGAPIEGKEISGGVGAVPTTPKPEVEFVAQQQNPS